MFKFFSSLGASSNFQKHRLQLTSKSTEAPSQTSLKVLLETFAGEDKQTRPQFAFAIIIKKIMTSDSRDSWIYLLKNLIILDRVSEEHFFNEELAALSFSTIDSFCGSKIKSATLDTGKFLRSFWDLIREKASRIASMKHVFSFQRNQRQTFLERLQAQGLIEQLQSTNEIFRKSLQVVEMAQKLSQMSVQTSTEHFVSSPLGEYLMTQMLNRMTFLYGCALQVSRQIIEGLVRWNEPASQEELKSFKMEALKFKINASLLVRFVQRNTHVRGFKEINFKELNPFHEVDVVRLIDEYMAEQQAVLESRVVPSETLSHELTIKLRPNQERELKRCKVALGPEVRTDANPFLNWINFYTKDFPPSDLLSVDFMEELRKQDDTEDTIEEQIYAFDRESAVLQTRQLHNANLPFATLPPAAIPVFTNIYSKLTPTWNQ